ncbi:MAG: sigma-70 family RNA polymerase sigma factor [Rikenellaceae bacterium]
MNTIQNISDQSLILSYRQGDEQAINTLIERHRKRVYNYILMLVKDSSVADDIFQDLFIKVIASLKNGKYSDHGKFISWLLRIAHNMVIDYFRLKKNQNLVSTDGENQILNNKSLTDRNIEDVLIKEQTEKDIRKLIDYLPLEQREVVVMRHYLGLSFKEIAEQTDVSINTSLGRMRYALMNLKKMMQDNNITLSFES